MFCVAVRDLFALNNDDPESKGTAGLVGTGGRSLNTQILR